MRNYFLQLIRIIALILLTSAGLVFAQTAEELRGQIESSNKEIEALEQEIARLEADLDVIGTQANTLGSQIRTLDLTRKKLAADIKVTERKISLKTNTIIQLSRSIRDKDVSISVATSSIAESVRKIAIADDRTLAEAFLAEVELSRWWDEVARVTQFQNELAAEVRDLKKLRTDLADNKAAVERERRELERLRGTLSDQKRVADNTRAQTDKLLKDTKSKESEYQKILREKERQKDELEAALNEYESKLEYLLDPTKLPPVGKGVLSWPLDHIRITQYFGKTVSARRLYVSGTHNGVDFGTPIGTPVKATAGGVIEGTGNTDIYPGCYSYGKWVLIRHGNGLSTVYGHLDFVKVVKGQRVERGEVVAYSGNSGYSTGPHLHLGVLASDAVWVVRLGDVITRASKCVNSVIPVAPQSAYLDPMVYL